MKKQEIKYTIIATASRSHPFYPGMNQNVELAFVPKTGEIVALPINELDQVAMSGLPREMDIPSAKWIIANHPTSKRIYKNIIIL